MSSWGVPELLLAVGEVLNTMYKLWWGQYQPVTMVSLEVLYCRSPETCVSHLVPFHLRDWHCLNHQEVETQSIQHHWSPEHTSLNKMFQSHNQGNVLKTQAFLDVTLCHWGGWFPLFWRIILPCLHLQGQAVDEEQPPGKDTVCYIGMVDAGRRWPKDDKPTDVLVGSDTPLISQWCSVISQGMGSSTMPLWKCRNKYYAVLVSRNFWGKEVGKRKANQKRQVWGWYLFYGSTGQWKIPVPNTSPVRKFGASTVTVI